MKSMLNISFFTLLITLFSCGPLDKTVEVVEKAFEDGKPQVVKYYKEVDSKKILVKEKTYYENEQQRSIGNYKNNEREGVWTYWFEDGKKWAEAKYTNGKEIGIKTSWHNNGQKRFEGNMKDGNRIGQWTFWSEAGEVVLEMDYDKK